MNNFLKESVKFRNLVGTVCVVLGNESCDLDSAVTSISLAYFYHKNPHKIPLQQNVSHVLPILNIPRAEYALKTEVKFYLEQNAIESEWLTFKDEVEENFLKNSTLILVDHHFSPFSESAVAVFDHRPFDTSAKLSEKTYKVIEQVGSCATLIGNLFLQLQDVHKYFEVLKLLYGPIVLDTANFAKEADRARPLDFEVAGKIEHLLNISNTTKYRQELFEELVKARADVSTLDSYQILFKDMKLVLSKSSKVRIAFPGYPILVRDYVKLDAAQENIKRFAQSQNCSIIVLIGMKFTGDLLERDVGVININNTDLFKAIVEKITTHQEPNLELEEYPDISLLDGKFFKQKNIKASRKQILPLVKTILED